MNKLEQQDTEGEIHERSRINYLNNLKGLVTWNKQLKINLK